MRRVSALISLMIGLGGPTAPLRADLLDEEEPKAGVVKPPPAAPVEAAPPTPGEASKTTKPPASGKAPAGGAAAKGGKPAPPSPPAAGAKAGGKQGGGRKGAKKKENEPVHFESKGLKGLRERGMVELVENVIVTQGDFRLEADHAQVFFDEAAKDVLRVVADGNVKIFNIDETTGEKLKALGNQVVFQNQDRKVVLDGNARLWRGDDSVIRGNSITYEMDTGWIRADRVAGELTPTEKDKK